MSEYKSVVKSITRKSCVLIAPVVVIFMMFLWTTGNNKLPGSVFSSFILGISHRVTVKTPAYIRDSERITWHSKPIRCSDGIDCHYFTRHRENTAPGTYFNYVFHQNTPPPIPILGVTAISPDWVGRLIDSIDHPVTRLVIVQNGESNSTNAVIEKAIQKYKRRFHGARVNYVYFKENEGCGAGFNSILRFAAPKRPSLAGYGLSRASYCSAGEREGQDLNSPHRRKKGGSPRQPLNSSDKEHCHGVDKPGAWAAVLNDDIAFRPGDLAKLSSGVTAHMSQFTAPKHGFLSFKYTFTDNAPREDWVYRPPLSAFVMTTSALKKWGLFDENFWPAFKEDNEFCVRLFGGEDAKTNGIVNCLAADVIDQGVRLIHGDSEAAAYKSGQAVDAGGELYATHRAVQIVGFVCGHRYLVRKWGSSNPNPANRPHFPLFVNGTAPAGVNGSFVKSGKLFDWAVDAERLGRMKAAFQLIKAHIEEDNSRCTDTLEGECAVMFLGDSVC